METQGNSQGPISRFGNWLTNTKLGRATTVVVGGGSSLSPSFTPEQLNPPALVVQAEPQQKGPVQEKIEQQIKALNAVEETPQEKAEPKLKEGEVALSKISDKELAGLKNLQQINQANIPGDVEVIPALANDDGPLNVQLAIANNDNEQQLQLVQNNQGQNIEGKNGKPIKLKFLLELLKDGKISEIKADKKGRPKSFTISGTVRGTNITLNAERVGKSEKWLVFNMTNPENGKVGKYHLQRTQELENKFAVANNKILNKLENADEAESIQIRHKPGEKNEYIVFITNNVKDSKGKTKKERLAVVIQHYTHPSRHGKKGTTKLDFYGPFSKKKIEALKKQTIKLNEEAGDSSKAQKYTKYSLNLGSKITRSKVMDSMIPIAIKNLTSEDGK